jgi:hypothetical protein
VLFINFLLRYFLDVVLFSSVFEHGIHHSSWPEQLNSRGMNKRRKLLYTLFSDLEQQRILVNYDELEKISHCKCQIHCWNLSLVCNFCLLCSAQNKRMESLPISSTWQRKTKKEDKEVIPVLARTPLFFIQYLKT